MAVQDNALIIGKSGCALLCYAKLFGLTYGWALDHYDDLVKAGAINQADSYVLDADKILKVANLPGYVLKAPRNSAKIIELFESGKVKEGAVRFMIGKEGHFVVVNKDNYITFNSLYYSRCVHDGVQEDYIRVWVK